MNYRYPGPQSFREEDAHIFNGRQRETKALYDLLLVQPLVVLFAKSGMGKTSLLQAGIIPKLLFTEFDPIKIRLNKTDSPPDRQAVQEIWPSAPQDATLWEAVRHYNDKQRGTPVLFFDQFEEAFTLYSETQRAAFIRQMADLINGYLPDVLRTRIREGLEKDLLSPAQATQAERPPQVKIVLSIRSDLLHFIHLLSQSIPSVLRNRFELQGLKPEQAEEAVVEPARKAREEGGYATPPFEYSPEAISQILGYLSRRKQRLAGGNDLTEQEIESFQLQLLCEHIERKVAVETHRQHGREITVTPAFYGGEAGIEEILTLFYTNTLAEIVSLDQRTATQRLLEDHLVRNENRVSIDEATIEQSHGVHRTTLDYLVDKRLLRRDARETGNYYEISHDTLLVPVLKSKADWETTEAERRAREAEEKARVEATRRADEEKLRRQAEAGRRRARVYSRIAVAIAALAVLLGLYAYAKQREALQAKANTERSLRKLQAKEFIQRGDGYYTLPQPDYKAALKAYQQALSLDNTDTLVQARIDSCRVRGSF